MQQHDPGDGGQLLSSKAGVYGSIADTLATTCEEKRVPPDQSVPLHMEGTVE